MTDGVNESGQGGELQFDKAEPMSGQARSCAACQQALGGEYYEVNGNVVCPPCASALGAQGKTRSAMLRALAFGAGAAIVSTLVWFAIIKLTDSEWGIVAIAVGLFVGHAVRRGAGGGGGRRYQALAMALTYCAITASHVPFVMDGLRAGGESAEPGSREPARPASAPALAAEEPASFGSIAVAMLVVLAISLASPFLAGVSGIMGLIIIAIALYEAWKLNRRVPVNGPFRFAAAALP